MRSSCGGGLKPELCSSDEWTFEPRGLFFDIPFSLLSSLNLARQTCRLADLEYVSASIVMHASHVLISFDELSRFL